MTKKQKAPSKGKKKRFYEDSPPWLGPAIVVAALALVCGIFACQVITAPGDDDEAVERPRPPQLRGYPSPDEAVSAARLPDLAGEETEVLDDEQCDWLLRWIREDPPLTLELLVFGRERGARHALGRAPEGLPVEGLGLAGVVSEDPPQIWFQRGRMLGRAATQDADLETLREAAQGLDMAIVRTWGAVP
jgi:hypothetical protein